MNKAYKFRIYPNVEQQELFSKTFGCVRFIYNKMLERSEFLVVVQQIRGGLIRNNKYITIARYGSTMTDREHFEFKGDGIVTHWTPMPELPTD